MNESKPTHLDLFSGIGGFSLAFEAEGFQTIGFAEIDPYASAVLNKHWPHVPNYGDITNVPAIGCDILTGGFPCQPFSCAGRRKGERDDRHLWPAMCNVISRCRPAWVVGENVTGIISLALDGVLADLESIGYSAQPIVVPACAANTPHVRNRVYILAHSDSFGLQRRWLVKNGHALADWSTPKFWESDSSSPEGCYGFVKVETARRVVALADGLPNSMDGVRCLGNSIVPQVAQIFARAIRQLI